MGKKILIVGVGAQGSTVAQRMDEEPNVEKIICADADHKAVDELVKILKKAEGTYIDANDIDSIAKGTPPNAACTVAFGVYAIMQNILSRMVSFVFNRHKNTPNILNIRTPKINITDKTPADTAYFISTVAPTNTNKTISATTHSLLNFTDNLFATTSRFFCRAIPIAITAIKEANGRIVENLSSNVTKIKDRHKMITTFDVSLICTFLKRYTIK